VLVLHLGLDYIDGVVEHRAAETSEASSDEVTCCFTAQVFAETLLCVSKHDESDCLICRLLEDGRNDALVESADTFLLCNCRDAVEDIFVLGSWRQSVVNQLRLKCFLGRDDTNSFRGTGKETAQESVGLAFLGEHVLLRKFEGSESD